MGSLIRVGVPEPWAPVAAPAVSLGRIGDETDEVVGAEDSWGAFDQPETDVLEGDMEAAAREVAALLLSVSGCTVGRSDWLTIRRGRISKRGFVTGRVHYSGRRIHRMAITLGPNSDLAEVFATLAHEVAHAASPARGHGRGFKETFLGLARAVWGDEFFDGADVGEPYHEMDGWVSAGIRAARSRGEPPYRREGETEQRGARIRGVLKLRRLAENQVGTEEGRLATAMANTIVTVWGLGSVKADLPDDVSDSLCDRFQYIGKRCPWRRKLAWAVGAFFDVYILCQARAGTMHWFGKQSAIEAGFYLYGVAEAHIERELVKHLQVWDAEGRLNGLHGRGESANFRATAVWALGDKLRKLRRLEARAAADAAFEAEVVGDVEAVDAEQTGLALYSIETAEAFALDECEKKHGTRKLGKSRRAKWSWNDQGALAGKSVPLSAGLDGPAEVRRIS